jgi:hypothetical protein
MRKHFWLIALGLSLVFMSLGIYIVHYLVFSDAHHIYIYLVGDLAFLPVEVLVVTLIVDQMLGMREKHAVMEKMNMVIGAFFSEMGLDLLKSLISFGICPEDIAAKLRFSGKWQDADFKRIANEARGFDYRIDRDRGDLVELRAFLMGKREFFLRLLENPSLLEHDTFTDLLWATNHLSEELAFRQDLGGLSEPDFRHIEGDIKRVFQLLIFEWLQYMKHLKNYYPYLFSLAVRTNPFDREACVEVS